MDTVAVRSQDFSEYPWRKSEPYSQDSIKGLSQEVQEFLEWVSPTEIERMFRNSVVQRIRSVVTTLWPSVKVYVYGSYSASHYTPNSDVDISLTGKWNRGRTDFPDRCDLYKLYIRLCQAGICSGRDIFKPIDSTASHIVKVTSTAIDLSLDFSFNQKNVKYSAQLVKDMCDNLPFFKWLSMTIKEYLRKEKLNKVFKGGLSSYSVSLLCASFLYMKIGEVYDDLHAHNFEVSLPAEIEEMILNAFDVGQLLIDFFEFYGTFDINKDAINWRSFPHFVPKKSMNFASGDSYPDLLIIKDPFDPENNVARGSFKIQTVLNSFRNAYTKLHNAVRMKKNANDVSILGEIISFRPEFEIRRKLLQDKYWRIYSNFSAGYYYSMPQFSISYSSFFYYNSFVSPSPIFIPHVNVYPITMGGHQYGDYAVNAVSPYGKPILHFGMEHMMPQLFYDPTLNLFPYFLPFPTPLPYLTGQPHYTL